MELSPPFNRPLLAEQMPTSLVAALLAACHRESPCTRRSGLCAHTAKTTTTRRADRPLRLEGGVLADRRCIPAQAAAKTFLSAGVGLMQTLGPTHGGPCGDQECKLVEPCPTTRRRRTASRCAATRSPPSTYQAASCTRPGACSTPLSRFSTRRATLAGLGFDAARTAPARRGEVMTCGTPRKFIVRGAPAPPRAE